MNKPKKVNENPLECTGSVEISNHHFMHQYSDGSSVLYTQEKPNQFLGAFSKSTDEQYKASQRKFPDHTLLLQIGA